MKCKILGLLALILVLNSCRKDSQEQEQAVEREAQKKAIIFEKINKGWTFYDTPINATSEESMAYWTNWRAFMTELGQKPKKTIGAFQQKATALSAKAMALNDSIPSQFNNPQIKTRIATLITQVRLLDLFINLDNIPDKKVTLLVSEINTELASLQRQMDKIVEKSKIPKEEGESDLLKMRDTTRAIPDGLTTKNIPHIE